MKKLVQKVTNKYYAFLVSLTLLLPNAAFAADGQIEIFSRVTRWAKDFSNTIPYVACGFGVGIVFLAAIRANKISKSQGREGGWGSVIISIVIGACLSSFGGFILLVKNNVIGDVKGEKIKVESLIE